MCLRKEYETWDNRDPSRAFNPVTLYIYNTYIYIIPGIVLYSTALSRNLNMTQIPNVSSPKGEFSRNHACCMPNGDKTKKNNSKRCPVLTTRAKP